MLQMGKHFLYLPLYFAAHRRFFGLLPDDVHVEIERCDAGTDEATYAQMMLESPEFAEDVIAVTDPVKIFNTELKAARKPAVVATLVTNGAFWAVNHGQQTINGLRDLGVFERVIAFAPGTTSYSIAARIARESGRSTQLEQFIEVVEQGKELLLLTDSLKGKNAVALSPDVLRIEDMVQSRKASIELALGRTAEYNDVLVTALVSHSDFVAANKDIIQAIVAAVQKALVMTRLQHPDVIQYAADAFRFGEHVAGALRMAVQADVIPLSTAVARAHWLHAAKAHFESAHPGSAWTKDEEARSQDYFRDCIEPYAGFAEEATRHVLEGVSADSARPSRWSRAMPFAVPVAAALASPLLGVVPTLALMAGVAATTWLVRQPAVVPYPAVLWSVWLGGLGGTVVTVFPYTQSLTVTDKSVFLTVGLFLLAGALTAAFVGYNLYYAKRDKT
jgi:hypothetical protein